MSVNPPVGSPGDLMVISGQNFGAVRTSSDYVQVGGSRITASGYLKWTANQIKIILPSNVQDGLVIVTTKSGSSKPGFFANEAGIPVEVPPDTKTSLPIITSVSPESLAPGNLLTISGINFGTVRNGSLVMFTAGIEDFQTEETPYLPANEDNYDYGYWSDSEIQVRVPDGAISGQIYVKTEKGESNIFQLDIKTAVGTKTYSSKKTYIINVSQDINDINSKSDTTLSLRVPRPPVSARQPMAELTECTPEPVFEHYQNTIIHQFELSKVQAKQIRFNHTFVVEDYSIKTSVNSKNVKPFAETNRVLYTAFTASNSLIHANDPDYENLAKQIVKQVVNPYEKAKLIYNYMIENFELLNSLRATGSDVKDLINNKKGDAYDFAIVYVTLLRASKIPAVPVAGILVDSELKSRNHWWAEFYIENLGWIPVDICLGAGLEYKAFRENENPKEFFFGNLDSQHIAFSRGFNELKPSLTNSHILYKERTYALQSIWEESSSGIVNYSSLWNDPIVQGLY